MGACRSVTDGFDAAVEAILIAQQGIEVATPGLALAAGIAIGMQNGADIVFPVGYPSLDAEKDNKSFNLFFYEQPFYLWPIPFWFVDWDDDGYYGGGEPENVTFIAYKNEQDSSDNPALMLTGLLKNSGGNDLTIPMIMTTATYYTRKDPKESGDTQLSDESIGNPLIWSLDFTTNLAPTTGTLH